MHSFAGNGALNLQGCAFPCQPAAQKPDTSLFSDIFDSGFILF